MNQESKMKQIQLQNSIINKLVVTIQAILFTVGSVYAQTNWKPGYVINWGGDTIHGSIQYKENRSLSKFCKFRTSNKSEAQIYLPTDITGFRFNDGQFFISKKITGLAENEAVFVEYLINGKVNLYRYSNGEDRFFIEKDTVLLELKNTTENQYVEKKNEYYSVQKHEYIGTFGYLLQDANMQKEITACEYRPKSMINLAKTYHETVCTDQQCIIYERAIKPLKVVFGIHGGLIYSSLNYGKLMQSAYEPSMLIGCRIEFLNFIDLKEKLSFIVDVGVQKNNSCTWQAIDENYVNIRYNDQKYVLSNQYATLQTVKELTVELKSIALKIPLSVNYAFTTSNIQPYLGAGLINMLVLTQNENLEVLPKGNSYKEYEKLLPAYEVGIVAKMGCKFQLKNKGSVYSELGYEKMSSLETDEFHRMETNAFSLVLGYNF